MGLGRRKTKAGKSSSSILLKLTIMMSFRDIQGESGTIRDNQGNPGTFKDIQGHSEIFRDNQGNSSTFRDIQGRSRTIRDNQGHLGTFIDV